eukprot:gnl/TRDRNA2_/TRDRNA2_157697_c0_seq2.p1 gnl/TRDRNA2_/TRDRNA2_157697_c0~~gnl/TRDRNA2_/TRDRNA2_157697_c0_seq2.p1  ORF type:complete len:242 (-),score=37.07 gnl/TRDRNA2_/TRDRNA2_157697_c0_seq2:77-802(-)
MAQAVGYQHLLLLPTAILVIGMEVPALLSCIFLCVSFACMATAFEKICPCIEWAGLDQYLEDNKQLVYRPSGTNGSAYLYPPNYGNVDCKAHDEGLEPLCDKASAPSWCAQKWCYVNPSDCTGVSTSRSTFFPGEQNLFYSYATCSGPGGADFLDTQRRLQMADADSDAETSSGTSDDADGDAETDAESSDTLGPMVFVALMGGFAGAGVILGFCYVYRRIVHPDTFKVQPQEFHAAPSPS